MRTIAALATVILGIALCLAISDGASNTVTTMLAIPLGAITGFAVTIRLIDAIPQRRSRSRDRIRARYDAAVEPIVLTPIRRAANDNVRRARPLALPAPAIAA